MLCCCFTWIVFSELNFTVAFLLRKTRDDQFTGKVGGWGILRIGWMILKWGGVDNPLRTMINNFDFVQ